MKIDFSDRRLYNEVYVPLLHDKHRIKILYGGRDSGKSDFVAAAAGVIKMLSPEYYKLMLVRKLYASIHDSQFDTIVSCIKRWELTNEFRILTSPLKIVCLKTNNKIIAKGLDQESKTKSIKDPTAAWFEEADEIVEDGYTETSLSLRTSERVPIEEWISFNPRKESSWINKTFFPTKNIYEKDDGNFHWVKSIRRDAVILHTTYHDNRFCTTERQAILEAQKGRDENYYKVNALGIWGGALKGLIYPDWTMVNHMPEGGDEIYGLDIGYEVPSALIHLSYRENKLYADEVFYETKHTPADILRVMAEKFRNRIGKKLLVVDSAEPGLITDLKRAGFNAIPSIKGPKSVFDGIMLVKEFELCVTKTSNNLISELQSYIWKGTKEGVTTDEPVKKDDHALDALRYPIQTYGKRNWLKKKSGNGAAFNPATLIGSRHSTILKGY